MHRVQSYVQKLDPVHNQGLRLCLGAFRTSPVESLFVDAHKPSLAARCTKLSLQYASGHKSMPTHPAHKLVFEAKHVKLFYATPNAFCTFGLHIRQILSASNISFDRILETSQYLPISPWYIKTPDIVFDLAHLKKDRTNALV